MEICSSDKCTGCGACRNICLMQCIQMIVNKNGFLHPAIDDKTCIGCGDCNRVCPINNPIQLQTKNIAFKASSINESILRRSTSGGIFSVLAKNIILKGGYVFGAELDEKLYVHHTGTPKEEYIKNYCGSKYIQSDTEDTFKTVKQLLAKGYLVLYSGTPCQIAGLRSYLGREYKNLFTCDFICHGVGSSKVFDLYKDDIEKNTNKKIIDVKFRNKNHGYINGMLQFQFQDRTIYEDSSYKNPFGYGFASDLITRDSCVLCEFACAERVADMTLADYSGDDMSDYEKQNGVSFLLINTKKGLELIDECKGDLSLNEKSMDYVKKYSYHLTQQSKNNFLRKQFFIDLDSIPYEQLKQKYLTPPKSDFIQTIAAKIKKMINKCKR